MNPRIFQKGDGITGVFMGLLALESKLTPEEFELFCDNTPDGEELWLAMTARRDHPDAPEGYNFISYAREVLAGSAGVNAEAWIEKKEKE